MRVVVLGDDADARGFRLAGVAAAGCRTREDVVEAVRRADDPEAVVLVSPAVVRLAPDAIDRLRDGTRLVLVLP